MRVVQAYVTSMVGSVDVVVRDQSLDDPLEDGMCNFWVIGEGGCMHRGVVGVITEGWLVKRTVDVTVFVVKWHVPQAPNGGPVKLSSAVSKCVADQRD